MYLPSQLGWHSVRSRSQLLWHSRALSQRWPLREHCPGQLQVTTIGSQFTTLSNIDSLDRCVCKKGFSGVNCQTVLDACATSPCLHNGHCISLANGSDFACACREGFLGKRCERDLNECASQPCLNGGTCHDLENNFRCTCPSGWTGDRCEQDVDECSALVTPCIHASACINLNGSYMCVCQKGESFLFVH